MASVREVAAMRRALEIAARGPVADPNPRVGCVILDASSAIVGEGYHRGAGTAHAEAVALVAAGSAARGGTAVVTLEPCTHTGRTGPCVDALLATGISRVVIGADDPNPLAAGGAGRLREAGADVEIGVLAAESVALNRRWTAAMTIGRPFVTWKFAATLDGRSAAADGTSRWITGEQARADVHIRRAQADAVLVGTGTVLADNPQLTVRDAAGRPLARQPLRVVLGRRRLPAHARVLDDAAPTLVINHRDPGKALAELHDLEVRHVWLEGGPTVAAAFWRAGLVDELVAYLAPTLLGSGAAAVADLGIDTIGRAARLTLSDLHRVGDDVLVVAHPLREATTHPERDMELVRNSRSE
jgi:diaminohydroxyphosphoribosylaminopyrimidine deaminase/5-amino-6-(5-phosphoribosylamino)uracil reductase